MKKKLTLVLFFYCIVAVGFSQNKIISSFPNPSQSGGIKSNFPTKMDMFLSFEENSSSLSLDDLDLLDSVYRITFSDSNYFLYKVTLTGYDDGKEIGEENNTLSRERVDIIYNYFKNRSKSDFLIRVAPNMIYNSCSGNSKEMIRFQVPIDIYWINLSNLPENKRTHNNIPLSGKVWMQFEQDREACIGVDTTCYVPKKEIQLKEKYTSVTVPKGAFYQIENSKSTCESEVNFSLEEHLEAKEILENYKLIPHEKQIILQSGFIVLQSNMKAFPDQCKEGFTNSIKIRIETTDEQWEAKIRMFSKSYSEKGIEYKSISTKRVKGKLGTHIESTINPVQIDTIYLGLRISNENINTYFFPGKESEYSVVKIKEKYYRPYKIDKNGEMVFKKDMKKLFRFAGSPGMEEPIKDRRNIDEEEDEELE